MRISTYIFFLFMFIFVAGRSAAQDKPVQNEGQETKVGNSETVAEKNEAAAAISEAPDRFDDANAGNKKGTVKQIKSARPDMSKSRGARPPEIVRPSGSRIPRGVGRPAGAGRHGR